MAEGRETPEEKTSQELLGKFLAVTDRVLDTLARRSETLRISRQAIHSLQVIWTPARANLHSVSESLSIGLSRTRRRALESVGMFGDSLKAKVDLLLEDIIENSLPRVLKRLNSMLGSLAKIFHLLHSVKEFKEHYEIAIVWSAGRGGCRVGESA